MWLSGISVYCSVAGQPVNIATPAKSGFWHTLEWIPQHDTVQMLNSPAQEPPEIARFFPEFPARLLSVLSQVKTRQSVGQPLAVAVALHGPSTSTLLVPLWTPPPSSGRAERKPKCIKRNTWSKFQIITTKCAKHKDIARATCNLQMSMHPLCAPQMLWSNEHHRSSAFDSRCRTAASGCGGGSGSATLTWPGP